jgi:hypothetical protein
MKHSTVIATAALVAAIPLKNETSEVECKDRSCVNEQIAKVPDQPHGSDEAIKSREPVDYIVVMSSPPIFEKRTPEILAWARQHGLELIDATPEQIAWIQGRERELGV